MVVAHAERDLAHIGINRLTKVRDRVHERDLGGEERVRRVLDHLRRRGVGDEHRRIERPVELAHAHRDRRVVATDHDAVGLEEVPYRRALAKELGVRRHPDLLDRRARFGQDPLHEPGGAHGHRRLVDHNRPAAQHGCDLACDVLDERQVCGPVVALRGRHAEEHELGDARRVLRTDDELQPLGREALVEQRLQTVLEDGDLTLRQGGDPAGVDVGTRDPVSEMGQAGCRGQPDVAGSDDRNITHRSFLFPCPRRPDLFVSTRARSPQTRDIPGICRGSTRPTRDCPVQQPAAPATVEVVACSEDFVVVVVSVLCLPDGATPLKSEATITTTWSPLIDESATTWPTPFM